MKSRNPNIAITLTLGFLSQCALLGNALAQTEPTLLTSEQQIEVIEAFSEALLEHYVLPEKAALLVDGLHQAQAQTDHSSSKTLREFLPNSSPTAAKTKSVWANGIASGLPSPIPDPKRLPDPIANKPCAIW